MAESQRRKANFLKNKKQKINFTKGIPKQKIISNLPTSKEEDNFIIIGADSKNILIVCSNILFIFSLSKQKIVNSIRFNFSVIDFKIMENGDSDEYILFKVEQNQLVLVKIQCNTMQSLQYYSFSTGIKFAVPHPSADFILILNDDNKIGIFDLMNVVYFLV
jgi:hypothetical protein